PANVRVLRAVVQHGGFMTSGMIVQQARITRMSVLSALRRLEEAGVIETVGSARQRLYRVDRTSPFAAVLDALFGAESAHYSETIARIAHLAKRLRAEAVWIYGSVARAADKPPSDLDLVVACPIGARHSLAESLRAKLANLKITPSV